MRAVLLLVLAGCTSTAAVGESGSKAPDNDSAAAVPYTADAYGSCAACHLPTGAGVPSAFPPINNRAASIAKLGGGREYLIAVVSNGLMGTIDVGGSQYFGVMPGNKGAMTVDAIADAINYVVFELVDDGAETEGVAAFSADEVESVQAEIGSAAPTHAFELRKALIEANGEQWPK